MARPQRASNPLSWAAVCSGESHPTPPSHYGNLSRKKNSKLRGLGYASEVTDSQGCGMPSSGSVRATSASEPERLLALTCLAALASRTPCDARSSSPIREMPDWNQCNLTSRWSTRWLTTAPLRYAARMPRESRPALSSERPPDYFSRGTQVTDLRPAQVHLVNSQFSFVVDGHAPLYTTLNPQKTTCDLDHFVL